MNLVLDNNSVYKIKESLCILFWLDSAYFLVLSILDCFGNIRRLLFQAIMRKNIDKSHEIYLFCVFT